MKENIFIYNIILFDCFLIYIFLFLFYSFIKFLKKIKKIDLNYIRIVLV